MASNTKTNVPVVFGAMTFGAAGYDQARVTDPETESAILSLFQKHGHDEVDTARIYSNGSSEEHLGALSPHWSARGLTMGTKLYPGTSPLNATSYSHSASGVRAGLEDSLAALQTDKIDLFYLHRRDADVPLEETLRAVDALHREGKFARFGVSNFQAWQVAEMCEIARRNGWIQPTVYQGQYNALQRVIEPELIPCLRRYGIALYAFAPLAGGILTGRYTRGQTDFEKGARFDPKTVTGASYTGRYFNEPYFDALDLLKAAADKHGFTIAECALRWIEHHSVLKAELGDKVIIGASSAAQLERNLVDFEKGPLPEDVVDAFEAGWTIIKGTAPKYWL